MATVLITGGTGLIGKAMSQLLIEKGYDIIVLTRSKRTAGKKLSPGSSGLSISSWDIRKQRIDTDAIQKADYILHLAGAGVADKRWTKKRKKEILESRVRSSGLLVKSLQEIPNKVRAVISASAIGWYHPASAEEIKRTETDPPDQTFLGETCRLWEESIEPVTGMNIRSVKIRTGIVLSNQGGAFPSFKKPIRFGICPILGSGKQILSWIHIDDLCRIYLAAIENEKWNGAYNAVAPRPIDNKSFSMGLAKKIKGKFFITFYIPSWVLKVLLGEMSIEVLKSNNISSEKIRNEGFQFLYPSIEAALQQLIPKKTK